MAARPRQPADDAPADDPTPVSDKGWKETDRALRILVVEDNQDLAESLLMLLELMGHRATLAAAGRAALDLARSHRYDAALIDVGLPDINGCDVARILRAERATKRMRLVAVSGYTSTEQRRHALEAGFDHHLAKPVGREDLERVLRRGDG